MALPKDVVPVHIEIGTRRSMPRTTEASFDVSRFTIQKMALSFDRQRFGLSGLVLVELTLTVPERDEAAMRQITFRRVGYEDEMLYPEVVRSLIHEAVMHEVDEMLLVNGERLFDPHRDGEQFLKVPHG